MRDSSEFWVKNETKVCDCIVWDYGLIVDVHRRDIEVTFSSKDPLIGFCQDRLQKMQMKVCCLENSMQNLRGKCHN